MAAALHAAAQVTYEATGWPVPAAAPLTEPSADDLPLLVIGAHLTGHPLNRLLTQRGGRFVQSVTTAPIYRLYELPATPPISGMVRVMDGGGSIAGRIWALPPGGFAAVITEIPSPLGYGQVQLSDGRSVQGFLCEAVATANAPDITTHGGWIAWLAQEETPTHTAAL